jgi:hypothetical protein
MFQATLLGSKLVTDSVAKDGAQVMCGKLCAVIEGETKGKPSFYPPRSLRPCSRHPQWPNPFLKKHVRPLSL